MYSEVVTYLQLCDLSRNTYICVSRDITSDVNFVYGEILAHCLKNNYSVISINFSQSCAHYNHVLLKFGVNIRQLKDNQCFITIDGLSEVEKLADMTTFEAEQNTSFRTLFSSQGAECVKQLYFYIKAFADKLNRESKQFVLLVDDMSSLLNLGLNLNDISLFVQYCRLLCINEAGVPNIFLTGSIHDNKDPENIKLNNYLLHLADRTILVEGLKTGYSKDANGKITLKMRDLEGIYSHEKYLFKVSEKGAKLLTLGL